MSNPIPNQTPTDREVPRPVRYFTNGFVLRRLTFAERIRILIGYNLAIEAHFATEHRPGHTRPLLIVSTTPHSDREKAEAAVKQEAVEEAQKRDEAMNKNALAKRKAFAPPPLEKKE